MFLRARSVQRTACNILALIRIDFLIAESHSHTLPNLRITPYFQVFAKSTLLLKTSNIMSESFKKTKKMITSPLLITLTFSILRVQTFNY